MIPWLAGAVVQLNQLNQLNQGASGPGSVHPAGQAASERANHFEDENDWMGVTMHAGDRLMGTLPEVGDVETSPTCRNLDDR